MAEKKEPTPWEKFVAKKKAIKTLTDTLTLHHVDAYSAASRKHLTDESGQVDYSKLENIDTQDKFVDEMRDFYVTKAREKFGISKDKKLNDEEIEMLLSAYGGHTRTELLQTVRAHGEDFSPDFFTTKYAPELKKKVLERLTPSASLHVKDEHKAGIIKEMGLEDRIDASKINTNQIAVLMHTYHENGGVIPEKAYSKEIYHKKPPAPKGKAA